MGIQSVSKKHSDKASLSAPLADLQRQLHRVLGSMVFRHNPGAPFIDMPISQLKCLHIVAEHEGLKMLEAAQMMEIKVPTLSQVVDKLVRRNMIERQPDLLDRRVIRLALTEEARGLMAQGEKQRNAVIQATGNNLTSNQMVNITNALAALADAAEKAFFNGKQIPPVFPPEGDPVVELVSRQNRERRRVTSNSVESNQSFRQVVK